MFSGAMYTTMVVGSALLIRRPPPGYIPEGYTPPSVTSGGANVHVDTVLKTPQFWFLFTTSTLLATGLSSFRYLDNNRLFEEIQNTKMNKKSGSKILSKFCSGGMGLMSVAKPMIQNVFTDAMPALGNFNSLINSFFYLIF